MVLACCLLILFFKGLELLEFPWCPPPLLTRNHHRGVFLFVLPYRPGNSEPPLHALPPHTHTHTVLMVRSQCFQAQRSSLSETATKFTKQLMSSHAVHTNSFALGMKTNWCPLEPNLLKHTLWMTHMNVLHKWNSSCIWQRPSSFFSDPTSNSVHPTRHGCPFHYPQKHL